jgi:hypothetical protein
MTQPPNCLYARHAEGPAQRVAMPMCPDRRTGSAARTTYQTSHGIAARSSSFLRAIGGRP